MASRAFISTIPDELPHPVKGGGGVLAFHKVQLLNFPVPKAKS